MNETLNTTFTWGHKRRFNSYTEYVRSTFGARVQKLSVDAGFSCPNRDGTLGSEGCTFCDNDAFNPSYCVPAKSITQQLEEGKKFHKKRYRRSSLYFAYFQAFSNTYASIEELKGMYSEAMKVEDVIGLVIGTRPDCIDAEKLDYLAELAGKYYVNVEYGIESCNNKTLCEINRGHDFEKSAWALEETKKRGIKTGAHFIIGLPGESREEIMDQTKLIAKLPINTIKFHQLQILRNTPMAFDYNLHPGKYVLFNLDEYIDFITDFITFLPPGMVIERFTAEVPPRYRIAPDWGKLRTDQILLMIEQRLEEKDVWQGKNYSN